MSVEFWDTFLWAPTQTKPEAENILNCLFVQPELPEQLEVEVYIGKCWKYSPVFWIQCVCLRAAVILWFICSGGGIEWGWTTTTEPQVPANSWCHTESSASHLSTRENRGNIWKRSRSFANNIQLPVPHLLWRKSQERQKELQREGGLSEVLTFNTREVVLHICIMRSVTCAEPHDFLLPLLFVSALSSAAGTNTFCLLQLEVEMKVLKSQQCTAEQSTVITKEEVDTLR